MAGTYNFNIDQGTDFEDTLTVRDENEDTIDITGWVFRSQAREDLNSAVAFEFTFEVKNQVTHEGQVFRRLSNAASAAISGCAKKFIYDVEAVDTDDLVQRVIQGRITLNREVTK
jgi:hypothetical protein